MIKRLLMVLLFVFAYGCAGDPPFEPEVPICERGIVGSREVSRELAEQVFDAHREEWYAEMNAVSSGISHCGDEWFVEMAVQELSPEIEARFSHPVDGVWVVVEEGGPFVLYSHG